MAAIAASLDSIASNGLTIGVRDSLVGAALASSTIEIYGLSGNNIPSSVVENIKGYASANAELRAIASDPGSYDLSKASSIVEESLVAKFKLFPKDVVESLKSNPSFVDEDGPVRDAVLTAAAPLTQAELLKNSPAGNPQPAAEEVKRVMSTAFGFPQTQALRYLAVTNTPRALTANTIPPDTRFYSSRNHTLANRLTPPGKTR